MSKFFKIVTSLITVLIILVMALNLRRGRPLFTSPIYQTEQLENSMDILGWIVVFFFAWPIIHVVFSGRSTGGATFAWFVFTVCFSWISYLIFLIVTQNVITKAREEFYQSKKEDQS